tara:strand:- start:985 stop:1164 length:180 start_codon:yes stop_codon:yes gene_type:complete
MDKTIEKYLKIDRKNKTALRKVQLEYYIERDSKYIKSLTQQLKENQSILRVLNKGISNG